MKSLTDKLSELEQIIDADKKRTPGEWIFDSFYSKQDDSPWSYRILREIGFRSGHAATDYDCDARFICLAANNLARLARENALMLKQLEYLRKKIPYNLYKPDYVLQLEQTLEEVLKDGEG